MMFQYQENSSSCSELSVEFQGVSVLDTLKYLDSRCSLNL